MVGLFSLCWADWWLLVLDHLVYFVLLGWPVNSFRCFLILWGLLALLGLDAH